MYINSNKINYFFFDEKGINTSNIISNLIVILALLNIITVFPDLFLIYSKNGLNDYELNKSYTQNTLFIDDIIEYTNDILEYKLGFALIIVIYLSSIFLLFMNKIRFICSVFVWLLNLILINSSFLSSYGADYMISFLLFVNVILNTNSFLSKERYSLIFGFCIRLLQFQLCIIYFFGGLGKAIGLDWFNGNAMWILLISNTNINFIEIPLLYKILSLLILLLELLYPLLVYINKKIVIIVIICMHLGIALVINLYVFSLVMITFNIIAFYSNELIEYQNKIKKIAYVKTRKYRL